MTPESIDDPVTQDIQRDTARSDKLSKMKTMYDVTAGEVFWRNFLAGMSRTLGGVLVYGVFLVVTSVIIARLLLPQLQPLLNMYTSVLNPLKQGSVASPLNIGR